MPKPNAIKNLERRLKGALCRLENTPVYLTEERDTYNQKIASVYYLPATGVFEVRRSKWVGRRNDYKPMGVEFFSSMSEVSGHIQGFLGLK